MDKTRAEKIVARYEELVAARRHYEPEWEDIARYIDPRRKGFSSGGDPARRNMRGVYTSKPITARSNLTATIHSTLSGPANRFFQLRIPDEDKMKFQPVKLWLDHACTVMRRSLRPSVSAFYSTALTVYGDDVTFGNATDWDEIRPKERRIVDRAFSIAEVVIDTDIHGGLVEWVRRYKATGPQLAREYGPEILPENVRAAADNGDATALFDIVHAVHPNDDYRAGMFGPKGKPWLSSYVLEEGPTLLRQEGYQEMPARYPRWFTDAGETYGRGQGYFALPSARGVNMMEAANIKNGQRAADPTLLAASERNFKRRPQMIPGATIFGGISQTSGRRLIDELGAPRQAPFGVEMTDRKIAEIEDVFHHGLVQLAGRTGLHPLEVMERSEEKMRLLAPYLGNIQNEWLAPKLERRFAMLWRAGQILPPPPEMGGDPLEVEFTSIAAMAIKAAEGAATVRFLQDLTPMAQLSQAAAERLADRIDPDGVAEVLQEARGVPARVLRSKDEADAIGAARAQRQQMMQAAELAPNVAGAMKDMAEAQAAGSEA